MAVAATIAFKSHKGNGFAFLSNFWPTGCNETGVAADLRGVGAFELDGTRFVTVEHFFQARKYSLSGLPDVARDIAAQPSALAAKRRNGYWRRERATPADMALWERERVPEMRRALHAKFSQNPPLRRALLATGAARLTESGGRGADFWAGGAKGGDMLGKLLMGLREELRREEDGEAEEAEAEEEEGGTRGRADGSAAAAKKRKRR